MKSIQRTLVVQLPARATFNLILVKKVYGLTVKTSDRKSDRLFGVDGRYIEFFCMNADVLQFFHNLDFFVMGGSHKMLNVMKFALQMNGSCDERVIHPIFKYRGGFYLRLPDSIVRIPVFLNVLYVCIVSLQKECI